MKKVLSLIGAFVLLTTLTFDAQAQCPFAAAKKAAQESEGQAQSDVKMVKTAAEAEAGEQTKSSCKYANMTKEELAKSGASSKDCPHFNKMENANADVKFQKASLTNEAAAKGKKSCSKTCAKKCSKSKKADLKAAEAPATETDVKVVKTATQETEGLNKP